MENVDTDRASSENLKQLNFDDKEKEAIQLEINKMIKQNIIERTFRENYDIVSRIFTREKKDKKSLRIILNLKKLNLQLETEKFKMTSIRSTLDMITPNMFLGSIDLVQAYYSIPIHEEYKKYLKFWWEGELFQFTCLPNGMCQAPFFFTKILKPVYSNLHSKGHLSTYYLDDSLIMGDTVEECTKICKTLWIC